MKKSKKATIGDKLADRFLQEPMKDNCNGRWLWAFCGYVNSDGKGTEKAARERYAEVRAALVKAHNAAVRRAVRETRRACKLEMAGAYCSAEVAFDRIKSRYGVKL